MSTTPRTIATGFAFPEGPRWHNGLLWFSDQHAKAVYALDPTGTIKEQFTVPGGPSGMGWLPNGDLLVISMEDRLLLRRNSSGDLTVHADLKSVHPSLSNDMVVDGTGRAYAGNVGFNFYVGETYRPTCIAAITPDGKVSVAADDLNLPNGTVITPDGKTLIIAETMGFRLTAFDVGADGELTNRRLFADLGNRSPDGICLNADGDVWVAAPWEKAVLLVREGGEIVAQVPIENGQPYACMLGGEDGRDLYICCAPDHAHDVTLKLREGRIDVARVDVGAAQGWP